MGKAGVRETIASMNPNPAVNSYLRTKVMTASPHELRMMLYEGAVRFSHQARKAIDAQDIEGSYNALTRAQKIVLELSTSLNHDIAPELCDKLSALYTYIYRLLVDANMSRDPAKLDEAIKLLEYERETWQLLVQQMEQEEGDAGDVMRSRMDNVDLSGAQQTAISSFSADG